MTRKEEKVFVSSGNVYADAGYANPQEALAKAELAMLIADFIKRKKLTQKKAAELIGIDQPKISAILRGQLSGFSIDRLFRFLMALGMDIVIEAKVHEQKNTEPSIYVMPPNYVENRSNVRLGR
ncbi:MAG: XRE family transcriptional regulator [Parachlamydiaceae bacterium]|nr:XRE family transcriptional regulator [Parachlamydiaceae bacterium]